MENPERRRVHRCSRCSYIYVESEGDHTAGIPPGTQWQALSADWACPHCGVEKLHFEPMDVDPPD